MLVLQNPLLQCGIAQVQFCLIILLTTESLNQCDFQELFEYACEAPVFTFFVVD